MFHLCAYTASYNALTETDLAALTDSVMLIQNGHFLPQVDMQGIFAVSMGTNLQRSRLSSPSMLLVTTPFIRPMINQLIGGTLLRVNRWARNPPVFRALEEIANLVTDNAGVAQRVTTLLGLGVGNPAVAPAGPSYVLRGTGATTLVANAWTYCPITWQNTLPNGTYSVIGMEANSANAQAARLTFYGQYFRPGCLATHASGDISDNLFIEGMLGEWGRFNTTTLPQIEFLANAADTTEEVYLYLVRVA